MQLTVKSEQLPNGWEIKKLGEVCEIERNQGIDINLPYIGMEHIESNTARFIGSYQIQTVKSSTFRFNNNHILYGRLRPYLNKVLAPDFEGHCSTEIFPIKPRECLNKKFLLYWLLMDLTVNNINKTCTGARMPRANMNDVLKFDFLLPSLSEQKRIVAILDEAFEGIDRAIRNTEKNLSNARELFESYLNSIFSQKGEGWEEKKLEDICNIKHGFAFKGEFFTSDKSEYILLTPGSFYESGGYRDQGEKTKYYIGEIPDSFILKKGDFLFAMTEQAVGLLGSSLIVPESNRFLHNQRLGLVQVNRGFEWHNDFFFHQFNTRNFRAAVQSSASGVKVRHTSPKKLGDISVCFPSKIAEQKTVADNLNELYTETQRLENIYRQKIAALKELKQSILKKAFTGELTADNPKTEKWEVAA